MNSIDNKITTKMNRSADDRAVSISKYFRYYFYVFLVTLLLWPKIIYFNVGGVGLSPFSVGTFVSIFVAAALLYINPRARKAWINGVIYYFIPLCIVFLFILWRMLCNDLSDTPQLSAWYTFNYIQYFPTQIFIASVFLLDERCRKSCIIIFCVAVAILGVIGISELLTSQGFLASTGLTKFAVGERAAMTYLTQGQFRAGQFRAQAIFSHAIVYGQFMGASWVFVWMFFRRSKGLIHWLALIVLFLTPLAVYASNTRSAIIVLAVVACIYPILLIFMRKLTLRKFAIYSVIAIFLLPIGSYGVAELRHIASGRTQVEVDSAEARNTMARLGTYSLEQSPIFGYGDGNSVIKAGINGGAGMRTIDNLYLTVAVDFGYPGLVLFVAFLVSFPLLALFSILNSKHLDSYVTITISVFTIGIAFGQAILSITENLTFVYFFFGYLIAAQANQPREKKRRLRTVHI